MSPSTAVSGWAQFRERFWSFGGASGRSTELSSDDGAADSAAAAPSPPLVSERRRRPSWSDSFAEFAESSFGRKERTSSDGVPRAASHEQRRPSWFGGDGAAAASPPHERVRRPSWFGSDGAAAASPPLDRVRRPSWLGGDGAAGQSDSSSKNDAWRALITDMEVTNPEEAASLSRQVLPLALTLTLSIHTTMI